MSEIIYEYKVLGRATVEVNGQQESLSAALDVDHMSATYAVPSKVESILNALASDRWEPVLLQPPFVFRRIKEEDR